MSNRPNIIVITTHDSGRHFGCYGRGTVHTPHIDQLASEGVQLDQYFAAVPICCASRASMLTGKYPQKHGLLDLCFHPFNWQMHDDVQHMSQVLHDADYRTHLFGLQHETIDINRLAFDEVHTGKHAGPGRRTCIDVAESLAGFLREQKSSSSESGGGSGSDGDRRPFYAQVGFFETHTPFDFGGVQPDDAAGVELPAHLDPTDELNVQQAAHLQGALRQVDHAVDIIRQALVESGVEDDTILVFTTDHGIEMPRAKWHLYDPGIEIACLIRYPRGGVMSSPRKSRRYSGLQSNIDFMPTVLDLAGVDAPADMDGLSFADALRTGDDDAAGRDAIFGFYLKNNTRCVRTRTHKLLRAFEFAVDHKKPVRFDRVLAVGVANPIQLYDLVNDPIEFEDLSRNADHDALRDSLDDRLFSWLREMNDPILDGPIRSPAYERAMGDYHDWLARQS